MNIPTWTITLLTALLLIACKSDDNEPASAQPTERVQVLAVFAPAQLGDQGYADRVMRGVTSLAKKAGQSSEVDVDFIASFDVETTCNMVANWVGTTHCPIDGARYSRRLVVLTEPYMVEWLAGVKGQLLDTDEVLMLKVSEEDVNAAAQILDMAGRIHGLNISAASSIRNFMATRQLYFEWYEMADESEVGVLRLYSDSIMTYRDSIKETLRESIVEEQKLLCLSAMEKKDGLYDIASKSEIFKKSYELSSVLWHMSSVLDSYKIFAIYDLGAANNGAEFFLMGKNMERNVVVLMLDAEPNIELSRFAITRYFDRALSDWVQLWRKQPIATMPLMELHGGWDGYCTDDIDPLEFLM